LLKYDFSFEEEALSKGKAESFSSGLSIFLLNPPFKMHQFAQVVLRNVKNEGVNYQIYADYAVYALLN
jgi:hypothetical protein